MFRKDVGSFVRLYDFMSQIIDYGDPELEKKQIYLRHLERVIQPSNYTAPIDLSDVVLRNVKQIDKGETDISLGVPTGLTGMTAAGSGVRSVTRRWWPSNRSSVRLNDLFGSRGVHRDTDSFVPPGTAAGPARQPRTGAAGAGQHRQQFAESPDFDDAVTEAVADNQVAHSKMADYFFTNAPGRGKLVADIAKWFYEVATVGATE